MTQAPYKYPDPILLISLQMAPEENSKYQPCRQDRKEEWRVFMAESIPALREGSCSAWEPVSAAWTEAQLLPPHCVPLPRHAALTPWVAEPTDVSLQGAGTERKLDGRRQREAPHRIISLTNFLRILMLGTQKRRDSCTNELRLVGLNPSADVFCLLKEADGVV